MTHDKHGVLPIDSAFVPTFSAFLNEAQETAQSDTEFIQRRKTELESQIAEIEDKIKTAKSADNEEETVSLTKELNRLGRELQELSVKGHGMFSRAQQLKKETGGGTIAEVQAEEAAKENKGIDTSMPEYRFRSYDSSSETAKKIKEETGRAVSVYPCYKINSDSLDQFVYYDADAERAFELVKHEGKWYVVIGDRNAVGVPGESDKPAEEMRENYDRIYKIWHECAVNDVKTKGGHRITGLVRDMSQKPLWAMLVNTVNHLLKDDLTKYPHTQFKMKDESGNSVTTTGVDYTSMNAPENAQEFQSKLSVGGYKQWYEKHISEPSKTDAKSGGSAKIAGMIKSMGLLQDNDITANLKNSELITVFNNLIQHSPFASNYVKNRWRESLTKLYAQYFKLDTQKVEGAKGEYAGPDLYDEKILSRFNNPDISKELRRKLFKLMSDYVLASEGLSSPSRSYAKNESVLHVLPLHMIVEANDMYKGSIYTGKSPLEILQAELKRRSGDFRIPKHGREMNVAIEKNMAIAKKLSKGVYVGNFPDVSKIIFKDITGIGGYIELTHFEDRFAGLFIPDPDRLYQFIPNTYRNAFVLQGDDGKRKGYLSLDNNGYGISYSIFNRNVMMFEDAASADDVAEMHGKGKNLAPVKYSEAYSHSVREKYSRIKMQYDEAEADGKYFYIDQEKAVGPYAKSLSAYRGSQEERSFLEQVAVAYNMPATMKKAEQTVVKETAREAGATAGKEAYHMIGRDISKELETEIRSYGKDAEKTLNTMPSEYIVKSADIIRKMHELGIDAKKIEDATNEWRQLVVMLYEYLGITEDPNADVSVENVEKIKEQVTGKEAALKADKVNYIVVMSFWQMMIRDLGDMLVEKALTKNVESYGKDTAPGKIEQYLTADYVSKTQFGEMAVRYLRIIDELATEFEIPNHEIVEARHDVIGSIISAVESMGGDTEYLDELYDSDAALSDEDYSTLSDALAGLGLGSAEKAAEYKNAIFATVKALHDREAKKLAPLDIAQYLSDEYVSKTPMGELAVRYYRLTDKMAEQYGMDTESRTEMQKKLLTIFADSAEKMEKPQMTKDDAARFDYIYDLEIKEKYDITEEEYAKLEQDLDALGAGSPKMAQLMKNKMASVISKVYDSESEKLHTKKEKAR